MNDAPAPRMRILEARHGAVLLLTMDYPARRNALALPLREQLHDILDAAQGDAGVRAIVLTGSDGAFCSGGDISGMQVASAAEGRERLRRVHRVIRLLATGAKPVVAAVEGWCVGAGLSLACACDTIIAAEDAVFMAGFNKVGLMADLGLPYLLPARIGAGRAKQLMFYARQFGGPEAERIGLVDELVPTGAALPTALQRAADLAAQAPLPMALTKQMLAAGLDAALEVERQFQATLFTTADHHEGRDAFLAKRAPEFRGS